MALRSAALAGVVWGTLLLAAGSPAAAPSPTLLEPTAVVGYTSETALRQAAAATGTTVVRRVPALRVAVLRATPAQPRLLERLDARPGILYAERPATRTRAADPAVVAAPVRGGAFQWQFNATRADAVSPRVLRAAASITIAVIDTGADLTAPDLAAKAPAAYDLRTRSADVTDTVGHGTFVASLAAGSVTNGDGIAGSGGDANLLVVKASNAQNAITDVESAAAIVYAVDRGARIVNLSFGGPGSSTAERRAVDYAVAKGALLVAAVGNDYANGNPVHYPAALLQPVGSKGVGGRGLVVGASTLAGTRAAFSGTGTHLSLVAPGERVLGAVSAHSPASAYPRVALPGAKAGLYGFGSGTSFAAPQVAGTAALVWAANPRLSAQQVADVIESTASRRGRWSPQLGFGVLDVAAAVAKAGGSEDVQLVAARMGTRVDLSWVSVSAASYRVGVGVDGMPPKVVLAGTPRTWMTFDGARGRTYMFNVTALDAAGAPIGASRALRVRLP